jgi:acetyl-CoA C-acetyltransferase
MKAVFVSAKRTPIGAFGGMLKGLSPIDFTALLIRDLMSSTGMANTGVDEVIIGQVLQAGLGQNPARQTAIAAGLDQAIPAYTVNKVCGSGLKTIVLGAQSILLGDATCVICGGMENMSDAPYLVDKVRWGNKFGDLNMRDSMIHDGLWEIFNDYHMGLTAENVAAKCDVSRERQDEFAFNSQQKWAAAEAEGRFKEEILPLELPGKKGATILFDSDEYPRPDTDLDKLSGLKPAFKKDGTVTPGNASGLNDGAALVLMMSDAEAEKRNAGVMAEIVSYASCGLDPAYMGLGPIGASRMALDKAGLDISDIDLFEINEAFASQAIAVADELHIPADKLNVNGGSIAMGHPIGASGTRIVVTLLHEMAKRNLKLGLASLCIGGGQGIAMVVKRSV